MTNFTDMTRPQLNEALAWARSHDWGRYAQTYGGEGLRTSILIHVEGDEAADAMAGGHCMPDHRVAPTIAGFYSLKTLRDWAGY